MAAERRDPDRHEREEWKTEQDIVQFLRVENVEYAEVGIASGHSPHVAPDARLLQFHCASGARDEFILAATALNLRKMAKLIPMPTGRLA
jgi:hypothetical protein